MLSQDLRLVDAAEMTTRQVMPVMLSGAAVAGTAGRGAAMIDVLD